MVESARAAEQVYVSYSALERSISVDALEAYAREGIIDDDLAVYAQFVSPEQLARLRDILLAEIDATPVAISQFLYSPQGEKLLERLGQVIKTEARQPGFYAIRAALIQAAAQPEGLTLLNVLRQYPTNGIRIDLEAALDIAFLLQGLVGRTQEATAAVIAAAQAEASQQAFNVSNDEWSNLWQPGRYTWQKYTLTLNDRSRDRIYPTDLYLPNVQGGSVPVIVISHGLGSSRQTYAYLAQHLATYGFAVAVPEHLGSNITQREALLRGEADEVAEPSEFIDRPLDIKFLLDRLGNLAEFGITYSGQLNLQEVGVLGQSFGGYTALALSGAPINFELLKANCGSQNSSWNVSLTLQCRALELEGIQAETRDPRIKAAIAINPIDSRILGEAGLSQIQTPVMIISGSSDTIAPALPEQINPFTWLTNTTEKYLVLMEGGTHFSTLQESPGDIALPANIVGPNPILAQRYTQALSLAFFQTYIADRPSYRPYLSSAYINALDRDSLPLYLLRSLAPEQVPQVPDGAL